MCACVRVYVQTCSSVFVFRVLMRLRVGVLAAVRCGSADVGVDEAERIGRRGSPRAVSQVCVDHHCLQARVLAPLM